MPEEQSQPAPSPFSFEVRIGLSLVSFLFIWAAISGLWSVEEVKPIYIEIRAESRQEISKGNTDRRQIILTFDGGDGHQSAEKILETLASRGLKGTFFLTGKFVESNPELVKKMAGGGHEIFSHTYSHPHLPALSDQEIIRELVKTDGTLRKITGRTAGPYFRAPYGERDERVLDVAFREGYRSVYWTVDAMDWEESLGETPESVEYRILSTLSPGNIYLLHLGDTISGAILPGLIDKIEAEGYKIVSLVQGL